VGTSNAYRRMGLAKAVIIEELRRLHQLGATRAVVQTMISNAPAIALYQSCGFEVVARDYGWAKANLRQ
jgi:ribosomal protein S18 acetylase RimI-like enzyme